jgi:hypothetical protein
MSLKVEQVPGIQYTQHHVPVTAFLSGGPTVLWVEHGSREHSVPGSGNPTSDPSSTLGQRCDLEQVFTTLNCCLLISGHRKLRGSSRAVKPYKPRNTSECQGLRVANAEVEASKIAGHI